MILSGKGKYFSALSIVVLFAMANWYCGSSKKEVKVERTTYAGLTDSATYVGMTTCSGCHPNIHSTFVHTGMGKSFGKATREKSAGNYAGHPGVYDKSRNMFYQPLWKNEELFFKEYRLEGSDTIYQREERISFIVGSGQHTNSHMWVSNGYVFQAPMTYYTQKGKWDLPPGFENGHNTRFNRSIGLECMTCHNGYPELVAGSENKFAVVQNGIDCERCHGPGSIHVKEKSLGLLVDTSKYIDYSIVNPSKLPIDLQFDVCQRCHVQGNAVLNEGKSFFDFKPGMRLSEVMNVFMPVYSGNEEEHIMASHAERLKMSKCFSVTTERLNSAAANKTPGLKPYKDGLTCITCHNPHVSVKETGKEHFNAACKNCHAPAKEKVCTEKSAVRLIKNDNCTGCHMPLHGTVDIPHVSVHDHRIGIHTADVSSVNKMKRFIGINCINNPNPPTAARAQAFINYVEKFGLDKSLLDSALKYLPAVTTTEIKSNIHGLVQVYYLKSAPLMIKNYVDRVPDLMSVLNKKSFDNKDAWTSYRIGEALAGMGDTKNAQSWYLNAYQLAPLYPDFANKYANALILSGDIASARKILSALVKEHPEFSPGFCNLGYLILVQDGNVALAHQLIDKALALDPDYELAILNSAAAFIFEKKYDEARKNLHRLLKMNPQHKQAKDALKRLESI